MSDQLSKTQQKKAERIDEAAAFVRERRKLQIDALETNYETGVQLYLAQKDTLSPEDQAKIEAMMVEQREALDKLRDQAYPPTEA